MEDGGSVTADVSLQCSTFLTNSGLVLWRALVVACFSQVVIRGFFWWYLLRFRNYTKLKRSPKMSFCHSGRSLSSSLCCALITTGGRRLNRDHSGFVLLLWWNKDTKWRPLASTWAWLRRLKGPVRTHTHTEPRYNPSDSSKEFISIYFISNLIHWLDQWVYVSVS